MRISYFRVSAFTSSPFGGNPAGVCPLARWLPDDVLQGIATENNLSETAFFTREKDHFHLRWFTPAVEVDLCGHATLASAFVLFSELGHNAQIVRFQTRSGALSATLRGDIIELDFPARPAVPGSTPENLLRGLGGKPVEVLKSRDYLAVFNIRAVGAHRAHHMWQAVLMQPPNRGEPLDDDEIVSGSLDPKAVVKEACLSKLEGFTASLALRRKSVSRIILPDFGVINDATGVADQSALMVMERNRQAIFEHSPGTKPEPK